MDAIYTTPTPKLKESIHYYKSLGFMVTEVGNKAYATSQQLVMEINGDRKARAGIRFFNADIESIRQTLSPFRQVHSYAESLIVVDPNHVYLYFETKEAPTECKKSAVSEVLGHFSGLSIETGDMDQSISFWSALGFKKTMGDASKGWVVYTNEMGLGISFMAPNTCPHLFYNPSLTYFNSGKNEAVIAKLKAAEVPIHEEISLFNDKGVVDNVILQDPGGFGAFVFND